MRQGIYGLAAAGLLLARLAVAQPPPAQSPEPLRPYLGKPVPNAVLVDVDGKKHPLSAYKGKVVLLVFWAPH
ncbi:MAG: hypothetical protein IMHGJWDQ_000094 [Candidatus Fervidibacter sp.]